MRKSGVLRWGYIVKGDSLGDAIVTSEKKKLKGRMNDLVKRKIVFINLYIGQYGAFSDKIPWT